MQVGTSNLSRDTLGRLRRCRLWLVLLGVFVIAACRDGGDGDGDSDLDADVPDSTTPDADADADAPDGCVPRDCGEECGAVDDGCGGVLDCGLCDGSCVRSIATGGAHTCFANLSGAVQCWGSNSNGQSGPLGVGSFSASAQVVPELPDAVQLAAGDDFTCARTIGGEVWCWGANDQGQLGMTLTEDRHTPARTLLVLEAIDISAADDQGCAVLSDASVYCWGGNDYGEVGAEGDRQTIPVPVADIEARDVDVGRNTVCAITTDGTVACWGHGENGELGVGSVPDTATPVAVPGPTSVVELVVATGIALARTDSGALWGWGIASPARAAELRSAGVDALYDLGVAACASSGGTLLCLGSNADGQLPGLDPMVAVLTDVPDLAGIGRLVGGLHHACGIAEDGALTCWGSGSEHQLGFDDDPGSTNPPREVAIECEVPCPARSCGTVGAECGTLEDGCGTSLECGECTAPAVCGELFPNRCDAPCVPDTCESLGATCGAFPDGCGVTLECGTCADGSTCASGRCVCPREWSAVEAVGPPAGMHSVDVAVDDGTVHVAWLEWTVSLHGSPLHYARRDAAGWSDVETIATDVLFNVRIALDGAGTPHLVYQNEWDTVHAVRESAGVWLPERVTDDSVVGGAAFDGDGTLWVVFHRWRELHLASRPIDGTWTTERIYEAPSGTRVDGHDLAVDDLGDLFVLFGVGDQLSLGVRSAGSDTWTYEHHLASYSIIATLAVGPDAIHIAWNEGNELWHSTRPRAGGDWVTTLLATNRYDSSMYHDIVLDSSGVVHIVYDSFTDSHFSPEVEYRRWVRGAWLPTEPLAELSSYPFALAADGETVHAVGGYGDYHEERLAYTKSDGCP